MYDIKRTDEKISEQMNRAADAVDQGTKVPGMTYEQGVDAAFHWLFGDWDDQPIEDQS